MIPQPLPLGTRIVVGAFTASGVVHLVAPRVFEPLIPQALGRPRRWVWASGCAELACAAGLATRQRWAPAATVATLAGVWVGNWTMAVRWQRSPRRTSTERALAWGRLPLQAPLIWWAWKSPRGDSIGSASVPARTLEQ